MRIHASYHLRLGHMRKSRVFALTLASRMQIRLTCLREIQRLSCGCLIVESEGKSFLSLSVFSILESLRNFSKSSIVFGQVLIR